MDAASIVSILTALYFHSLKAGDRVYLTGVSCGAIGVWDYIAVHGDELIAAAVPIAGHAVDAFGSPPM